MKSLTELEWKYPSKGLYYDLNDFFADRYHDGTQQFLYDLNFKARPLVIFLDSFDEYMPKLATAFPKVSLHTDSIALNTAWITNKVNNSDYKKEEPKDYSVLAHELGHILLNDSHVFGDEPNLMHHKLALLNGRLTKSQCQTIKRNLLSFN